MYTCSMGGGLSVRGGLGGANSVWSMPRGTMESSLTGTIGGRSPPDSNTHRGRERERERGGGIMNPIPM